MRDRADPLSVRSASVQADWSAWLPENKNRLFLAFSGDFETSYTMLSVSLNEAISLRLEGRLAQSRQASMVLGELSSRLTRPLADMLRVLGSHARHFGTVPNFAPLDPTNFRGSRCQRAARMSSLLSYVLLTQRSQYLHKVDELQGMVENLEKDFCAAATEVAEGTSVQPAELWLELDLLHYDLNTCLRESIVVLKSFLLVLPDEELAGFEQAARARYIPTQSGEAGARAIGHRRQTPIAGK